MIWAESKEGIGTVMNIRLKKVIKDNNESEGESQNE